MKHFGSFLLALAALSIVIPPGRAASKEVDLKRDVLFAKSIVLGDVERVTSYYGADGEIYSDVTLRVRSALKDSSSGGDYMTFTTPGGEVGDVGVLYTAAPRFSQGEPVMVFLEATDTGSLRATAKYEMNLREVSDLGISPLELLVQVGRELGDAIPEAEWRRGAEFLSQKFAAKAAASNQNAAAAVCYKLMGPKWGAKAASYKLDATLPTGFGAAVTEAAATWTNAGTPFKFSLDTASGNAVNFAVINTAGVLASTRVSYQPSTNTLVNFTLTFNSNYTWSTAGEAGKFDVQNVGTHELGHALGLDHPADAACSEQTMWASAGAGETKKRTIESGDVEGEVTLYGSGTATPPPPPTPTVLVPSFTGIYIYPRATVNRPFSVVVAGSNFDAKTLQYVLQGPGCAAPGCILDTAGLQQVSATQALGVFTVNKSGVYKLNLRNGATGALSAGTAQFTVR